MIGGTEDANGLKSMFWWQHCYSYRELLQETISVPISSTLGLFAYLAVGDSISYQNTRRHIPEDIFIVITTKVSDLRQNNVKFETASQFFREI
jgi:hypothetical protein